MVRPGTSRPLKYCRRHGNGTATIKLQTLMNLADLNVMLRHVYITLPLRYSVVLVCYG